MDGRVKRKTFAELMAEAALQGMPEDKTTADLLSVPLSRGAILPLTEYLDRAEFDLSSGLPGAFADAVTAPARAARGEISEAEQIPEAFNFAGSLTLGSLLAPRPTGSVGMGGRAAKGALDMSEAARMARAKEMGFDTENVLYHGSPYANLIKEFDMASPSRTDSGWLGTAAYMSPKEFIAKAYATPMNGKSTSYPDRGVLSLYAKKGKYKDFEYLDTETYQGQIKEFAKSLGVDGEFGTKQWSDAFRQAMIDNGYVGSRGLNADGSIVETAIYDPSNIRSVNAAFDPAQSSSANLLAANAKTGAAVPLATKALEAQQPQGIRAFQGSPHNYKAERLIEWPDGRTEYIEGMPDVLPDIPEGAKVLKDFPLGRVRLDKVGTGEGAQAYGYGAYAAEAEDVARSYRDALSAGQAETPEQLAKSWFGEVGDRAAAADEIRRSARRFKNTKIAQKYEEAARILESDLDLNAIPDPGHMYEVNIKADPQDFLDWDKPLSQQSEKVRGALTAEAMGLKPNTITNSAGQQFSGWVDADGKLVGQGIKGAEPPANFIPDHVLNDPNVTPQNLVKSYLAGDDRARASKYLREAGIPGIRYLDQMSRGAGEGSSNYVVFDDAIIDIVKKYGIAGLALLQAAGYGTNEGEETQ